MILCRRADALYTLRSCDIHVVSTRLDEQTSAQMAMHSLRFHRHKIQSEPSESPSLVAPMYVASACTVGFFFFFRRLFLAGDDELASILGGGPSRLSSGILECCASSDTLAAGGADERGGVTGAFEVLVCGFAGDGGTDTAIPNLAQSTLIDRA